MGWYTGRALAQTVYTLLYMHELPTIEHKWFSTHPIGPPDLARPDELVSLVLRSGVIGLVKSCHQVHKELLQRNLYDVSYVFFHLLLLEFGLTCCNGRGVLDRQKIIMLINLNCLYWSQYPLRMLLWI
jgi:hypothetical protein